VLCVEKKRNTCKVLVERPKRKRAFEIPMLRWEENIHPKRCILRS